MKEIEKVIAGEQSTVLMERLTGFLNTELYKRHSKSGKLRIRQHLLFNAEEKYGKDSL